ncbi:MAG: RyR domain-containing protein [Phycisphaeraceae bacterium]
MKVQGREPVLRSLTDEQVELLAEIEHGRWVIERTWLGWTLGPRDDKKRQRPQLVGWHDPKLPESEREKDRQAVRRIPDILAAVGYEIIDDPQTSA